MTTGMRMKRLAASMLALALGAAVVQAEPTRCRADLNGMETLLEFDTRSMEYRSLWEGWSPLAPDCPSAAIIARLKPDVPYVEWRSYCVITDDQTGAYLAVVQGPADRFGRCRKTGNACRAVNSAKDYSLATLGGVGGVLLGSDRALRDAGLDGEPRDARRAVLKGVTRYVAGTLGTAGTTAVSIVTAPEVLIGAAAGAVVIGGAVLICND
jgi:hypothetical protein